MLGMNSYEQRQAAKIAELKPQLTDEFLSTIVEAARVAGWIVDHIETISFVKYLYSIAEKACPDLEPYDYSEELKE